MRSLFLATVILSVGFSGTWAEHHKARFYPPTKTMVLKLQTLGIDQETIQYVPGSRLEAVVSDEQLLALAPAGIRYRIIQPRLEQFYAERGRLTPALIAEIQATSSVQNYTLGSLGGFHSYAEVVQVLDKMREKFPGLISPRESLGKSVEGRDLWMVRITGRSAEAGTLPKILFDAMIHAREPQGMENLLYFMWYLLENFGQLQDVTQLLNTREIYFVPVINPDGYVANERSGAGGGMWRKNRRVENGKVVGVDLNRNWSYQWGYDNSGSSPSPYSETYRGPAAFSEPESSLLRDLCLKERFAVALNYHTYSNLVIYPFGYVRPNPNPDAARMLAIAKDLARYNQYEVGTAPELLYTVNGESNDWMYGELKIFSYTIEAGSGSDGFWPSPRRIIPLCEENLYPCLQLARIAGTAPTLAVSAPATPWFLAPGADVSLSPVLSNFGLAAMTGVTRLRLSAHPAEYFVVPEQEWVLQNVAAGVTGLAPSQPFVAQLKPDAPWNRNFTLTFTSNTKEYVPPASVSGRTGYLVDRLAEDAEGELGNWTLTGTWGKGKIFHHGAASLTDSPEGNSAPGSDTGITLAAPLDFSRVAEARLKFWANFYLSYSDWASVEASTDGTQWTALGGQFTRKGSGYGVQPRDEPGYAGNRTWFEETMDLTKYAGISTLYLRFRLRTAKSGQRDGWYLDDVKVAVLPAERP